MAEIKCAECGVEAGESTRGWTHCEECDTYYCPKCSGSFRREKEDIDQLREGRAWDRVRILCPRCRTEMAHVDGI